MMKMIHLNFHTSRADHRLIAQIAARAAYDRVLPQLTKMDIAMDLMAVHCNGCPLQIEELLKADALDFAHDVIGIHEHLDRGTGKLSDFWPRFAKDAEQKPFSVAPYRDQVILTLPAHGETHLPKTEAQEIAYLALHASHAAALTEARRRSIATKDDCGEIELEFNDRSKALFLDGRLFNVTYTFDLEGNELVAPRRDLRGIRGDWHQAPAGTADQMYERMR